MKDLRKYPISALIIARNEETTAGKVLDESISVLPKLTSKYEILVNDDASSDQTPQILDSYAKKHPHITVFHQKKALGISGGLEYLYRKAQYELIFINAADGQYTIKDLPKMVSKIYDGYDLIIGKRKTKKEYGVVRKMVSFMFNLLPKILFGVDLYDPGSNKLYKKEVLQNTKPRSKSAFSEAERIIRAYQLGYKIISVPIKHFPRKKGSATGAKFGLVIQSLTDMLKFRFNFEK